MRYRILIQNRDEKDKHIACISFESNKIKSVEEKLRRALKKEISERQEKFALFLQRKKKGFIKELIDEIPDDLIDWKSKGNDISKEEFLENEMWFGRFT